MAAKALFAENKYQQFADKIKNPPVIGKLKEYIPQFDSLQTSLKFLKPPCPPKGSDVVTALLQKNNMSIKLKAATAHVSGLESKLQVANEMKAYIQQRKQLLKEQLGKFGMLKDMKALNKEVYYYQAQLGEYKAMLKDPAKIEQKALAALNKLPVFAEFMKKNSMLAQLFKMPDSYGTPESLAGLQTRASVQNMIQAKFAGSGVDPQQYIGQQMQQAQGELNKLKNHLTPGPSPQGGEGGSEMPDFKPNSQKTKSFLKRIEYGANVQTQKTNGWLPVTTDFAMTAGYKLNDKSIVGVGSSFKMGWGSGISDIKISGQGLGLRTFVDYKIKSGFWFSGGYEKNYLTPGPSPQSGEGGSNLHWQTSGLMGITKKYKIGKKMNSLQVLWDFLSYQQVPRTQAVVFRVGVVF